MTDQPQKPLTGEQAKEKLRSIVQEGGIDVLVAGADECKRMLRTLSVVEMLGVTHLWMGDFPLPYEVNKALLEVLIEMKPDNAEAKETYAKWVEKKDSLKANMYKFEKY